MFTSIQIPAAALSRMVPKHILTLDEAEFALGGPQRVKRLRAVGALRGKREGKSLAFDSGHVARVAADYMAGKYDELIAALPGRDGK